jgi:hypothetical protein
MTCCFVSSVCPLEKSPPPPLHATDNNTFPLIYFLLQVFFKDTLYFLLEYVLPPVLFTLTQVVLLLITSTFTFTRVQIQSNLGTTTLQYMSHIVRNFSQLNTFLRMIIWYAYHTRTIHVPYTYHKRRGGKNRRARKHCSQEMLNSCRKFV